jgi:hypothetical protein
MRTREGGEWVTEDMYTKYLLDVTLWEPGNHLEENISIDLKEISSEVNRI